MKTREEIEKAAIEWADKEYGSGETEIQKGFIAGAEYIIKAIEKEQETYKVKYIENWKPYYYNDNGDLVIPKDDY